MSFTKKALTDKDPGQTLQGSFNDEDNTIGVNGFLVGLVGRRIDLTITSTTVSGDTENYAFSENGTALYTLKIVYTDGTRSQLLFAQRTA